MYSERYTMSRVGISIEEDEDLTSVQWASSSSSSSSSSFNM